MDLLVIAESLEKFVEKASRPGVLGLPGRRIEKKTRTELGQYFDRIGAEVIALNLQDRVMHNAEAAKHVVDMALHNVLRKNRQLLRDTLITNMEKAYLTALKLDYVKESVEDEPRDDHGRWTVAGVASNWRERLEGREKMSRLAKKTVPGGELEKYHPGEIDVYRGVGAGSNSHLKTGTSWSKSRAEAAKHGDRVLKLTLTKDTPALDVGKVLKGVPSKSEHEGEVFLAKLPKGTKTFKEADDFQLTPPETTIIDTTSTLTQNAAAWAEQNAGDLVTGIDATTADLISNAVADGIENQLGVGGIGRAIKDIMDSMTTYRAESIASTEINRAMSAAAFEKMDLLGIEYKQIVLSDDACPICEENAAADPLPIDEDYPSGDSGSPFHPNCRCAMTGARAPEENS